MIHDIPLYESSKSIDEDDIKSPVTDRKPRTEIEWALYRTFENAELASSSLDSNKWSRYRKTDRTEGVKLYFRCNQVKLRGPQCAAAIYDIFANDNDEVLEYRTKYDHTHDDIQENKETKLKLKSRDY